MASSNSNYLNKIKSLQGLAGVLETARSDGKIVVQCHGVFDLLHIGHIRHFEQAKACGDVLVVTITSDDYVNKGPGRPAFNENLRAEAVASLGCVDYVAVNYNSGAVESILALKPSYYAKGADYKDANADRTGGITLEEDAIRSIGGQIVFTEDITFSSSNLINRHLSSMPEEAKSYLANFSARYSTEDILSYIDKSKDLRVLVVGETIIDEYCYCDVLGKSGKEPILAAKEVETERFAGGTVAIANHVSSFVNQITLLTFLGRDDSQDSFIRHRLNLRVDPHILYLEDGAPTICKRRFVQADRFVKLFEVYSMGDGESKQSESQALYEELKKLLPDYDLVIVADYGHGMLSHEAVDLLCSDAQFLAVNSQLNAGNQGFNIISKYQRADFICISESEIRLDARSRVQNLKEIMLDVYERLSCKSIIVTRGEKGSLCYSHEHGFSEIPALTTHVVDRVGAGDAVLSVTSLCIAQGAPVEVAGFIGNVSGSAAVATVGNRSSIEQIPLIRHIETLLK